MKRRNILRTLIVIICLILIGWGVILFTILDNNKKSDFYGTVYEVEAPDFTLTDQNGSKVSLSDFDDEVVLLFFGYTNCPDICPMTMSAVNNVVSNLGEESDQVQVLFISVDPVRDTQEKLKGYMEYFNEDFIGLTGSSKDIDKVTKDYNVVYSIEENDSASGYLIGHTSTVLLINPDGKIFLRYPQSKLDPELIAGDIKKIL